MKRSKLAVVLLLVLCCSLSFAGVVYYKMNTKDTASAFETQSNNVKGKFYLSNLVDMRIDYTFQFDVALGNNVIASGRSTYEATANFYDAYRYAEINNGNQKEKINDHGLVMADYYRFDCDADGDYLISSVNGYNKDIKIYDQYGKVIGGTTGKVIQYNEIFTFSKGLTYYIRVSTNTSYDLSLNMIKQHNFSWFVDGDEHYQICSICNIETARDTHVNKEFVVSDTKHSTECYFCGYATESMHDFVYFDGDSQTHTLKCNTCKEIFINEHSFNGIYLSHNQHYLQCSTMLCGEIILADHRLELKSSDTQHFVQCKDCEYDYGHSNHNWSDDYTYDSTRHYLTCDTCLYFKYDNHQLQARYDGVSHYNECTICSAIFNKSNHSFSIYSNGTSGGHTAKCSGCSYSKTESHSNTINYTSSNHYYTCTKCSYVSGQSSHSGYYYESGSGHYYQCYTCPYSVYSSHALVSKYDNSRHYSECTSCSAIKNSINHSYTRTYNNTSSHLLKCTGCSYSATESHSASSYYNSTQHYSYCSGCASGYNYQNHSGSYYDDGDSHYFICNGCSYFSQGAHEKSTTSYKYNNSYHYHTCKHCNATFDMQTHTMPQLGKPIIDERYCTSKKCSSCNYEEKKMHDFQPYLIVKFKCSFCGYVSDYSNPIAPYKIIKSNEEELQPDDDIDQHDHSDTGKSNK